MKQLRHPGLWLALALTVALGLWPALASNKEYTREIAFTILRAVVFASSLNILLGYTGYVSFGHIVFFGLGGYVGFYLLDEQNVHLAVSILRALFPQGLVVWVLSGKIDALFGEQRIREARRGKRRRDMPVPERNLVLLAPLLVARPRCGHRLGPSGPFRVETGRLCSPNG